jgi:chromosomal replication initiation ATPase DnaA
MTSEQIIIETVCTHFGCKPDQLRTPRRDRELVEPRMFAMMYLKEYNRLSLEKIGRLFNRHHATVLHGIRVAGELIQYNGYRRHDKMLRMCIEAELAQLDSSWMERVAQI